MLSGRKRAASTAVAANMMRNAVEAIRTVQPWGLDVCSGVRTNGRLDAEKLAQLFAAVHSLPPGTLAGSDRAVRLR